MSVKVNLITFKEGKLLKKKVLTVLLFIICALMYSAAVNGNEIASCCPPDDGSTVSDELTAHCSFAEVYGEDFMRNYHISSEIAENILDSFSDAGGYPDSFGGMYFMPDGTLAVLTTGEAGETNMGFGSDVVSTRAVEFSYGYLRRLQREIVDIWEYNRLNNPDCPITPYIAGVGVHAAGNRTFVMLRHGADTDLFRYLIIDHPALYLGDPFRNVTPLDSSDYLYTAHMEYHADENTVHLSNRYWHQGAALLSGLSILLYHKFLARR